MTVTIPNISDIAKRDPKLGEALTKIQAYVRTNVTPVAGNKVAPPSFVTPGQKQG